MAIGSPGTPAINPKSKNAHTIPSQFSLILIGFVRMFDHAGSENRNVSISGVNLIDPKGSIPGALCQFQGSEGKQQEKREVLLRFIASSAVAGEPDEAKYARLLSIAPHPSLDRH